MAHDKIYVTKIDEVKSRVRASASVKHDISDLFTFEVPGAKFMPKVKAGVWDGKIRLYNIRDESIYTGLLPQIKQYAEDAGITFKYDYTMRIPTPSPEEIDEFIEHALDHHEHNFREYQEECVRDCLSRQRAINEVPTGAGKSLIIGVLARFYVNQGLKVLIVAPRVGLVNQLAEEGLEEYGNLTEEDFHIIKAKAKKQSDKQVFVSTWQSIQKQPKKYFEQFDVVMGDEVHEFEAPTLVGIMEKSSNAAIRLGFTGSLKDAVTHLLTLTGTFGPIKKYTSLRELIDDKTLSAVSIHCLVLKHKPTSKIASYEDEVSYIIANERRNKFIRNLAWREAEKGNVLVLFHRKEKHGHILNELISDTKKYEVFYVDGDINIDVRDAHRKYMDTKSKGVIGVVSFGTFSMGTNITNVSSVILGSPTKSKTKLLQTLGRGVRRSEEFDHLDFYDLADDFRASSKSANFTLNHFLERVSQYDDQKLEYTLHNLRY